MLDKRLTELCPESKKFIAGNIIFQWLELVLNTIMISTTANVIQYFSHKELGGLVLI